MSRLFSDQPESDVTTGWYHQKFLKKLRRPDLEKMDKCQSEMANKMMQILSAQQAIAPKKADTKPQQEDKCPNWSQNQIVPKKPQHEVVPAKQKNPPIEVITVCINCCGRIIGQHHGGCGGSFCDKCISEGARRIAPCWYCRNGNSIAIAGKCRLSRGCMECIKTRSITGEERCDYCNMSPQEQEEKSARDTVLLWNI